jgi:hypothetical protein
MGEIIFMIWLILALSQAVRIDPEFITADVTARGSDARFDGFSVTTEITLAAWIKRFDDSEDNLDIFHIRKSVTDQDPSFILNFASNICWGFYLGSGTNVQLTDGPFVWNYYSLSFDDANLQICQTDWSSHTIDCQDLGAAGETPLLGSDFEVKVFAQRVRFTQVQLYSFEILNTFLSAQDLQAKATAFSCHTVCTTCFGPAPNACNEFTALIGLDEVTIGGSDSLVIPDSDVKFQGRSYSNVENLAVTFWFYLSNYDSCNFISLINFHYPTKGCPEFPNSFGFPNVVCLGCARDFYNLENLYYLETCQGTLINSSDSFDSLVPVRSSQGYTNGWLFSGTYYDNTNMFTRTFLSKFGAEGQSQMIPLNSRHLTWDSSAGNQITIKAAFSECSVKFMDVRVYFNPPDGFSLAQIWSQSNQMNSQKYWRCFGGLLKYQVSHNEISCVQDCPEGSHSDGVSCTKCKDGTYADVDDACLPCNAALGCATCSSATQCSTCLPGMLEDESNGLQCVNCPAGTILVDSSCRAFDCSQIVGCATCSSESRCLSCIDTRYSLANPTLKCVEACPFGFYSQDNTCLPCSISCAGCFGPSSSDCEDCAESFHKINAECSKCADNSFYDGAECQSCASQCKTCDSSVSCLSCQEGLHLSEGTCLDTICPPGSFVSGSSCTPCSEGCALCTESGCYLCQGDIKLLKGTCVCKKGYCVEEGECKLEFTVLVDELSVKLDFMNALSPVLSSSEVLLTSNYTHSINYSVSALSLSSFLLNLDFSENPEAPIEISLQVHAFDVSQAKVSEVPKALLFNFTAKVEDTSLTDQTSQEMASTAAAYSSGAVAISALVSGSPSVFMSMLNAVQYISFIPLMNVHIEPQLRGILIGSNPFVSIPNILSMLLDPDYYDKPYSQAEDFGYDTSGFLINAGTILPILALVLVLHLCCALGTLVPCCGVDSLCRKKLDSFHLNLYLVYLIGVYMELHAAAAIQLISASASWAVIGNCILAAVFMVILVAVPVLVVCLASAFESKTAHLFRVMFDDVREGRVSRCFYAVYFLHRYLSLSAIMFSSSPYLQLSLCLAFSLAVSPTQKLLYLGLARPFKDKLLFVSHLVADSCSLLCLFTVLVESAFDFAKVFLRYSVMSALGLVFVVSFAISIKNVVVATRRRRIAKINLA